MHRLRAAVLPGLRIRPRVGRLLRVLRVPVSRGHGISSRAL